MHFQEHHLFQLLRRFDQQTLALDLFLNRYFREHTALGSKDRRFISETIYGMIRWKALLDHLCGKQLSWEKRYEIFKRGNFTQYLNVSEIPLHLRVSSSKEFFELLSAQYGEQKAIELSLVNNTQAPTTVRVNALKTNREELFERWNEHYEIERCTASELGIRFKKRQAFFEMPEFKAGHFEVQDEASQLVSALVKVKPGEQVLDYCAGSGGKTLGFAHLMQHKGQIYLHDNRPQALLQARKRLKRADIQNAQCLNADHPQLEKLKKKMDWVIVDAPCSGTGTLRRNPDMKWKFTKEMLARLCLEQRLIFERALSFVRPQGMILYATCSLLQEENEDQAEYFIKKYGLERSGEPFSSLPTVGGMDGFFAMTFRVG